MPKLRAHRVSLDTPAGSARLRVHRVELGGTIPPKLRLHRVSLDGAAQVIVQTPPDRTVEPGTAVEIVARLQVGVDADSYTFTQLSGPPVALTGTGRSRTFIAPSQESGTSVVIGIAATRDGVQSNQATAAIEVLPEIEWRATASGWVPSRTYLL